MAYQIRGKIIQISPTQQIPSKDGTKTYLKREVVIDATRFDPYTGQRSFENTPLLEFSGDKCSELDHYQIGQIVCISFDIQGTQYKDRDNNIKFFTKVRAYKIEEVQVKQSAQPTQQVRQTAYPSTPNQPIQGSPWLQQQQPQQGNFAQQWDNNPPNYPPNYPPQNDLPY